MCSFQVCGSTAATEAQPVLQCSAAGPWHPDLAAVETMEQTPDCGADPELLLLCPLSWARYQPHKQERTLQNPLEPARHRGWIVTVLGLLATPWLVQAQLPVAIQAHCWPVTSGLHSTCPSSLDRHPHPHSRSTLNTKWSRLGCLSGRFWKSCLSYPRPVGFQGTPKLFAARSDPEKASARAALTVWDQREHNCRDAACPRRMLEITKRTHSIFKGY